MHMVLSPEYLALVGAGEHVMVDGKDLVAWPMTSREYIEYVSLSPRAESTTVDGVQQVVYRTPQENAMAIKSLQYVLWTVLKKNGITTASFEAWQDITPAGYENAYMDVINKVLRAILNQKKN
jgi:hypothetical protein